MLIVSRETYYFRYVFILLYIGGGLINFLYYLIILIVSRGTLTVYVINYTLILFHVEHLVFVNINNNIKYVFVSRETLNKN